MKCNKVISIILSFVLCISCINIIDFHALAEEKELEKVYVSAVVNGNSQNMPAIKNKDGVVFFSGKTLSDITVYQNNTAPTLFQHDKANDNNKYREILIDKSKKNAQLVSFWSGEPIIKKTISLPDIIEKEGELFFPVAEMLPLLNSNASVEEGKLYIEDVEYSMSNIMPEFNISDYMFNMYDDNDFLGLSDTQILAGYSYLFNGLVDFELKKFVPIIGARAHRIESYEEIFTSYLAEDDAYFAAIGDEEHYDLPMINYLLDDDSERINTVIEGMEAANDIVKDYSGYDISSEDLKMIKSSAALGKQLDYAIKLYSFAAIYTDHVTDHYEMLDAIYGLDFSKIENNRIGITEESYSAAKKVYEMYSDDQKQAIANYIGKQIENKVKDMIEDGIKDGISEELALGHAFAWSKLAASVMKAYFIATDFPVYNVSRKCENLRYYNKLMERGVNQFWAYNNAYDNISKDNIEKARLSAIFALLSSRSMYQALLDSEKAYGHSGAVYQRKIDSINEALKKMYLAKNCCLTDSEEYIDINIDNLKNSISKLEVDNYESGTSDLNNSDCFEMYKSFFFDNYTMQDKVCLADVTHDSIDEMIVVTEKDEGVKVYHGIVYSILDGNVTKIYEKTGGSDHASGFFNWYLTCNDGVWNLAEEYFGMWQGHGETGFKEYYLNSNGDTTEKKLIFTPQSTDDIDNDGVVLQRVFDDYVSQLTTIINNSYRIVYCHSEAGEAETQKIETNPGIVFGVEKNKQVSIDEISSLSKIQLNIPAYVIGNGGLNLRTGPSESNQIITLIPKKTKLNVISIIDNYQDLLSGFWVYVDYNGQKGYVNSGYLSFETQLDMDNLSSEQIFVIGMILYHRYLSDTHVLSLPSVLKLNYDIEVLVDDTYENNNTWYRKILPQGLHISDIESAYIEEFSKKYNTPSYSQYFIEHDGYVWEPFGFGGDVEFDYAELVKLYKITETEIEYIIKEHRRNAYGTQMEVEVEFTIVKEDGIWKCGKITKHA